jgi:hypothetical protein
MLVLLPSAALAQPTNISATDSYSWGENFGWMDWHNDPAKGVAINASYLEGSIWCEHVGWITVGDGAPFNGVSYANVDDTDFGVNKDAVGALHGFAWSEQLGWINFDGGALATPPNPARIDATCRFRGYAWAENAGWVNLDDAVHFVAYLLDGDVNGDGIVNITDLGILLSNFGISGPGVMLGDGDLNGDMAVNITDLGILLSNFGNSCP